MGEEKTTKEETINAIDFTKNLNEEYKKLFDEFPAEEIFPLENIEFACINDNYKIIKFFNGETQVGTAFVAVLKKSKYLVINYIYIEKKLRGKGYGHTVLNILKSKYADYRGIIVEVEPSNTDDLTDITNRRLKYYKDLNFNTLNFRYKILQTGTNIYQEMLLYMYNLNNPTNYIYTYNEIAEILMEYYKAIFDTDYEKQYQLLNL